ncbi:MAG: hypothetical protein LBM27_00880 [Lactobacillaceae bacterium]|jgi:hypothetical protein|nr:hypothetical protein [Lactobacillaceae bacterium]
MENKVQLTIWSSIFSTALLIALRTNNSTSGVVISGTYLLSGLFFLAYFYFAIQVIRQIKNKWQVIIPYSDILLTFIYVMLVIVEPIQAIRINPLYLVPVILKLVMPLFYYMFIRDKSYSHRTED